MSKRKIDVDEDLASDPKRQKPIKAPKNFDGNYFELVDWDGQSLNIKAKCQTCQKELKGQYTSTGNFFTHYR